MLAEDEEDDPERADTCELLLITDDEELEDVTSEDEVDALGL